MTWQRPSKWTRGGGAPPTFTTCKGTRAAPPQPFTTCKWTRVGGPATLHDLETASKWTRVEADFQMDKGWGPPQPRFANGQGLAFTTPPPELANGQGLGGPNPSRLTNGQGLGAQPFTTCKWTTVGQGLGPPEFHPLTSTAVGQGLDPLNLSRFGVAPQINFTASTYVSKPTRRLVRRWTKQ